MQSKPFVAARPGYWLSTLQAAQPAKEEITEAGQITTFVAGTRYGNRPAVVNSLTVGDQLQLVPEPTNLYDRNAIRVERLDGSQVGYIPRHLAALLAGSFQEPLQAKVIKLDHSYAAFGKQDVTITFACPVQNDQKQGEKAYEPVESDL